MKATNKTEIEKAIASLNLVGSKIVDITTDGVIPSYMNWEHIFKGRKIGFETDSPINLSLDNGETIAIYIDGFKGEYRGYYFTKSSEINDMEAAKTNDLVCQLLLCDAFDSKIAGYELSSSVARDENGASWEVLKLKLDNGRELSFDCDPVSEYMYVAIDYSKS